MSDTDKTRVYHWEDREKMLESARKGGKRSAQLRKTKTEIKKLLQNPDEMREDSIASYLENNPDAYSQMWKVVFEKALEGERWAIEIAMDKSGHSAAKRTESRVEVEDVSPEEALRLLQKKMG